MHEQFRRYCDEMADSAVWGGQAELKALAHVLQRRIDVFSVGMPTVAMGEEFTGTHGQRLESENVLHLLSALVGALLRSQPQRHRMCVDNAAMTLALL